MSTLSAPPTTSKHASTAATTQFSGFLLRDYFGDSGATPTKGVITHSPDIIPYGSATLSEATAASSWPGPTDIGTTIVGGYNNNIWLRCKNISASAHTGTGTLYASPPSLLMTPSTWVNNQCSTAGGNTQQVPFVDCTTNTSKIQPNDVGITNPAFFFSTLPQNGHYCFIGIANWSTNTSFSIPASFSQNATFAMWVANNPNVGWRNFNYFLPSNPSIVVPMAFGNTDATTGQFMFQIVATSCPTGTSILLSCTAASCPINVTLYLPAPDSEGNQTTSTTQSVPGNFSGTLTVTATAPSGQTFSSTATLETSYIQLTDDIASPSEAQRIMARPMVRKVADEHGNVRSDTASGILLGNVTLLAGQS